MERKAIAAAIAAGCFIVMMTVTGTSMSANGAQNGSQRATPGEKIDSGLGNVPHFREWHRHPGLRGIARSAGTDGQAAAAPSAHSVPSEKIDSGLGELPRWADGTGRIEPASAPIPR